MLRHDQSVKVRVAALAIIVGAMWLVRALDALLPGDFSVAGDGITPRTWSGLWQIPITPFIHASWEHLVSNTVPFVILGGLVLARGLIEFVFVFLTSTLVSGLGIWLFGAGGAQHVGASGVVFGLFGYLIFRAAYDRRLTSVLITLGVALMYGTMMGLSLIPTAHVSWSGHFFGFVGGFVAARRPFQGSAPHVVRAPHPSG